MSSSVVSTDKILFGDYSGLPFVNIFDSTTKVGETTGEVLTHAAVVALIEVEQTVGSNTLPTLEITGDTTATEGDTVDLTAVVTDPNTGDTLNVTWTVSEGTAALSNESVTGVSVTKVDAGSVTIQGIPNDGAGSGQAVTHTIVYSVAVVQPTVEVTASPTTADAGQTVTFTATTNKQVSYLWVTGETSQTIDVVAPVLDQISTLSRSVTVSDVNGLTATASATINVEAFQSSSLDHYNRATLYAYIPTNKTKSNIETKTLLTNVSYKLVIVINDGYIKGSQFEALSLDFYKMNERIPFLSLTEGKGLSFLGSFIEVTILNFDFTLGSQIYAELSNKGNTKAFIESWHFELVSTRI